LDNLPKVSGCVSGTSSSPIPYLGSVGEIAIDRPGSLLVVDFLSPAIFRVDLLSGDRSILSDANHGDGPNFTLPTGIAVDRDGTLIVTNAGLETGKGAAVMAVDPVTGDRKIISDEQRGSGPSLFNPELGIVGPMGNVALRDFGAVWAVDKATGDRSVLFRPFSDGSWFFLALRRPRSRQSTGT
jgi:hypothetical protein